MNEIVKESLASAPSEATSAVPVSTVRAVPAVGVAEAVILVLILAGFALLALRPARQLAPGYDEIAHIGAAYDMGYTGRNSLNPEHPPLMKQMAGLGLRTLAADALPPERLMIDDQWKLGQALVVDHGHPNWAVVTAARAPFLVMALVALLGVWWWSRRLAGAVPALLATALAALSPVVVAGAGMVLTDLLVGVAALWAMALADRSGDSASPGWPAACGVAAGLACVAKFTGLMVPVLALGVLVAGRWRPGAARSAQAPLWPFLVGLVAVVVLDLGGIQGLVDYRSGMSQVGANHRASFVYYLFGEYSKAGFRTYFPATMLVKSTLPELAALVALAGVGIAGLRGWTTRPASALSFIALAAFPFAYLAALIAVAPDLGHRYTAPLYLFLPVAFAVALSWIPRPALRPLVALPLVLLQGGSLWRAGAEPFNHFNGLFGCSGARAMYCLDGSNIEWGRTLSLIDARVAPLVAADEPLVLSELGVTPFDAYIRHPVRQMTAEDWQHPEKRLYVISTSALVRWAVSLPTLGQSPIYQAIKLDDALDTSFVLVDMRDHPAAR